MVNRITIAWYANFEKESPVKFSSRLLFRPHVRRPIAESLRAAEIKPSLLWDNAGQMLFMSLPPPMLGAGHFPNAISRFYGIKDNGNYSSPVFESDRTVVNMVLYESNMNLDIHTDCDSNTRQPPVNAAEQLWVSLPDGKLQAISKDGNVSKTIDLPKMLNANFTITSKLMTTKSRDLDEDFLIFGIHVTSKTDSFIRLVRSRYGQHIADADYFIVGYDTPENKPGFGLPLAWMIPTPENLPVTGQIVGVTGTGGAGDKDRIIAFVENEQAGKLLAIARK